MCVCCFSFVEDKIHITTNNKTTRKSVKCCCHFTSQCVFFCFFPDRECQSENAFNCKTYSSHYLVYFFPFSFPHKASVVSRYFCQVCILTTSFFSIKLTQASHYMVIFYDPRPHNVSVVSRYFCQFCILATFLVSIVNLIYTRLICTLRIDLKGTL